MEYLHCPACGVSYGHQRAQEWPRKCPNGCGEVYRNPLPVGVALQPVGEGLLLVRRGIEPEMGGLCLPCGYIEYAEDWQHAIVRELFEETGVEANSYDVQLFDVGSSTRRTLLVFGLLPWIPELPKFDLTPETTERVVITGPIEMCFPLHTLVVHRYFSEIKGG